jgi:hypothetical protein
MKVVFNCRKMDDRETPPGLVVEHYVFLLAQLSGFFRLSGASSLWHEYNSIVGKSPRFVPV